jgi:hypothetical protein
MELVMYIMAPEPISTACFINPFHQSVCLYVYPHVVARQGLGKHVPAETNTRNGCRTVGRVVFCTVRVVWKASLWVCLCIPNFSLCTAAAVVWRLPEPSDSKIWSWVPWDSESTITVLVRASSNLLEWTGLCISLPLLGNGSVNTFSRQRRIVGGVVFCAVRVVSKESRRLVLTRTSFFPELSYYTHIEIPC